MFRLVLALIVASASAFVATPAARSSAVTRSESLLDTMEGGTAPFGVWDPLGLTDLGTEKTLAWYRAAEIKHGRVAMAANVGFIVSYLGITFPGDIATGVPFSSLGKGVAAFGNIPDAGKLQMLAFIGLLEISAEYVKPHYLSGGSLGYVPGPLGYGKLWDPVGFVTKKEEELATLRNKELNNGRLAMISAIGIFSASAIDGSVPLLHL